MLLAYAAGRNAAGRVHEGGEFGDVGATVAAWLARHREGRARRADHRAMKLSDPAAVADERAGARTTASWRQGGISGMTVRPADVIERKRNGGEHSAEELEEFVLGYVRDEVADYQMAAWCMAVYFNGLTGAETYALTDAMIRSGDTLDVGGALGRKVVDKHSTGGVGDKTSIAVGPIVAACGVPLGKMSGRGLGHTGGTLDKLESIPGFRVELSTEEMIEQLRTVGMAIVGQSDRLVPADKKLYALRDVTGTVDIEPLIASSIMSKKLAAGADAIVLDVKVGDGAFMKSLDEARSLADRDDRPRPARGP